MIMKELSIEEKAKAYDEASKWMEGIYPTLTHEQQMEAEAFFQIFKESEDEKIRKELVQFFEEKDEEDFEEWIPKAKVLAWLEKKDEHANFCSKIQVGDKVTRNEDGVLVNLTQLKRVANKCIENAIKAKQGEYKPQGKSALEAINEEKVDHANKVEPKFKVGDWVVRNGETLQISSIDTVLDGTFHYWFTKGSWLSSKKMENAMLWTIQDAKDGDVLYSPSCHLIWIYKDSEHYHACLNMNYVTENTSIGGSIKIPSDACPATKEQNNALMKAMADAGYTFDFEKKELKKIEQKSAWSEEDEIGLCDALWAIQQARTIAKDENDMGNLWYAEEWLKSLKDRIQPQPKQEWSEEDEKLLDDAIGAIDAADYYTYDDKQDIKNWLKALKERYTWKPSDKQMNTLEYYMHTLVCNEHKEILFGLYADLKKLKK